MARKGYSQDAMFTDLLEKNDTQIAGQAEIIDTDMKTKELSIADVKKKATSEVAKAPAPEKKEKKQPKKNPAPASPAPAPEEDDEVEKIRKQIAELEKNLHAKQGFTPTKSGARDKRYKKETEKLSEKVLLYHTASMKERVADYQQKHGIKSFNNALNELIGKALDADEADN